MRGLVEGAGHRLGWRPVGADAAGFMNYVIECPNSPNIRLMASDVGGIWRSIDSGVTWSRASDDGFSGGHWKIGSIAWWPVTNPSATDAGRVLVMAGTVSASSGVFTSVIYESTDWGTTFHTVWKTPSSGAGSTFGFTGDTNGTYGNPVSSGKGLNGSQANAAIALPPADGTPGDSAGGGFEHPRQTGRLAHIDTTNNFVYFASFADGVWRVPFTSGTSWYSLGGISVPGGSVPAAFQVVAGQNKGVGFSTPSATTDYSNLYAGALIADPVTADTLYFGTFGNGLWRVTGAAGGSPTVTQCWTPTYSSYCNSITGSGMPSGTTTLTGTGPGRIHQMGWWGAGSSAQLVMVCNNDGVWAASSLSTSTPTLTNLSLPGSNGTAGTGSVLPLDAGICHWQSLGLYHGSDHMPHVPVDGSGDALLFVSCSKPRFPFAKLGTNASSGDTTITLQFAPTQTYDTTACPYICATSPSNALPLMLQVSSISSKTVTLASALNSSQALTINASTSLYQPAASMRFAKIATSGYTFQSISNGASNVSGWVDPWCMQGITNSQPNYSQTVYGTNRSWWISSVTGFMPDGNNFAASSIRVINGANGDISQVHLSGRSGMWLTTTTFGSAAPCNNGLLTTYSKGGVGGASNQDMYICFSDYASGYTSNGGRTVQVEALNQLLTGSPYGYDIARSSSRVYFGVAQRNLTPGNASSQAGYVFSRTLGSPPTSTGGYQDEVLQPGNNSSNLSDNFNRTHSGGWGAAPTGGNWTVNAGGGANFSTYPLRNDTATITNGSATVADISITSSDNGKPVSGTGIPAGSFVGTVTVGTSFLLSSSPTSQVNVIATAGGSSVIIGGVSGGAAHPLSVGTDGLGVMTYTNTTQTFQMVSAVQQLVTSGSILFGTDTTSATVGSNIATGIRIVADPTASYSTYYEIRAISTSSGNFNMQLRKFVNGSNVSSTFFNGGNSLAISGWSAQPKSTMWQLLWTLTQQTDDSGNILTTTINAHVIDASGNDTASVTTITATDSSPLTNVGDVVVFGGTGSTFASTIHFLYAQASSTGSASSSTSSQPYFAPLRLLAATDNLSRTRIIAFVNQTGVMTKLIGTDSQFSLSTGDNPMGASQPSQQTMWVTASSDYSLIYSLHPQAGAFRSTDYGQTWKQLWGSGSFSSFTNSFVGGLAIDPAHPNDLIVVTPSGGVQILQGAGTTSSGATMSGGLLSGVTLASVSGPTNPPSTWKPGICIWSTQLGFVVSNQLTATGDASTLWASPHPSAATPTWNRVDDNFYRNTVKQLFALNETSDGNVLLAHCSANGVLARNLV